MRRKVKQHANAKKFGRRRKISKAEGFVKYGCAYCNTLLGDIQRDHTFRKCPRHAEGIAVAATIPVATHHYFVPPAADGRAQREVSRSFYSSVYQVSKAKVNAMLKVTVTHDINTLLSRTGRHGHHTQKLSD